MTHSVRKDVNTGNGFKYRVKVRAFKHSCTMHDFLNRQDNNDWSVMDNPVKSGTYVKSIDPSALAHM